MDSAPTKKFPQFLSRSFMYHHHGPSRTKPTVLKPIADDSYLKPSKAPACPATVLYTTSLRSIRRTHEDCFYVRSILRGFRVTVDERDVAMDSSFRRELQSLLPKTTPFSLPQLFVGGKLVGGAEEVRALLDSGELVRVLEKVRRVDPTFVCRSCGGARFLPCGDCSGSRKIFVEDEGRLRRCEECNENGLVRCPNCCSS